MRTLYTLFLFTLLSFSSPVSLAAENKITLTLYSSWTATQPFLSEVRNLTLNEFLNNPNNVINITNNALTVKKICIWYTTAYPQLSAGILLQQKNGVNWDNYFSTSTANPHKICLDATRKVEIKAYRVIPVNNVLWAISTVHAYTIKIAGTNLLATKPLTDTAFAKVANTAKCTDYFCSDKNIRVPQSIALTLTQYANCGGYSYIASIDQCPLY